jgi:hypothetical protein
LGTDRAKDSSADATFVARLLTNSDDLEHKGPENDACVPSHTSDVIPGLKLHFSPSRAGDFPASFCVNGSQASALQLISAEKSRSADIIWAARSIISPASFSGKPEEIATQRIT